MNYAGSQSGVTGVVLVNLLPVLVPDTHFNPLHRLSSNLVDMLELPDHAFRLKASSVKKNRAPGKILFLDACIYFECSRSWNSSFSSSLSRFFNSAERTVVCDLFSRSYIPRKSITTSTDFPPSLNRFNRSQSPAASSNVYDFSPRRPADSHCAECG